MQGLCPLCKKNGVKSRIKTFQINLQEAVSICEEKECVWPFGYQELIFFQRIAISCDWEESLLAKEHISMLMELSLYTPPVTPSEEVSKELTDIANNEFLPNTLINENELSLMELIDSNNLPLLESLENKEILEENENNTEEENTNINIFRALPKITNIQKTSIDLTAILPNNKSCDNRKIQKHKHSFPSTVPEINIVKETDASVIILCEDFGSEKSDQTKESKVQLTDTINRMETNLNRETFSEITKDPHVTRNSNISDTTISTINTSDDLDTMLEDILNTENCKTETKNKCDWLTSLLS